MNGKSSVTVAILTILGVVIGSLLGYIVPSIMLATSFLGSLYLGVLILIALPLFITSIGAGITYLGGRQKFYRTTAKSATYFGLTGLAAIIIGALVVHLIRPGISAEISSNSGELVNSLR